MAKLPKSKRDKLTIPKLPPGYKWKFRAPGNCGAEVRLMKTHLLWRATNLPTSYRNSEEYEKCVCHNPSLEGYNKAMQTIFLAANAKIFAKLSTYDSWG